MYKIVLLWCLAHFALGDEKDDPSNKESGERGLNPYAGISSLSSTAAMVSSCYYGQRAKLHHLGLVRIDEREASDSGSSNQASQSSIQSITQGIADRIPGMSGDKSGSNIPGMSGGVPNMSNIPGMSGGVPGISNIPGLSSIPGISNSGTSEASHSQQCLPASLPGGLSSPEVTRDIFRLITDPCTYKTLQHLAKLFSDIGEAQKKEEKKDS